MAMCHRIVLMGPLSLTSHERGNKEEHENTWRSPRHSEAATPVIPTVCLITCAGVGAGVGAHVGAAVGAAPGAATGTIVVELTAV